MSDVNGPSRKVRCHYFSPWLMVWLTGQDHYLLICLGFNAEYSCGKGGEAEFYIFLPAINGYRTQSDSGCQFLPCPENAPWHSVFSHSLKVRKRGRIRFSWGNMMSFSKGCYPRSVWPVCLHQAVAELKSGDLSSPPVRFSSDNWLRCLSLPGT